MPQIRLQKTNNFHSLGKVGLLPALHSTCSANNFPRKQTEIVENAKGRESIDKIEKEKRVKKVKSPAKANQVSKLRKSNG